MDSHLFPDEFILVPASYCDGISILTDSDGFYIATERTQWHSCWWVTKSPALSSTIYALSNDIYFAGLQMPIELEEWWSFQVRSTFLSRIIHSPGHIR